MSTPILDRIPAIEVLQQSQRAALRNLSVHESDDAVLLLGSVSSYYMKQLAQETIRPVLGGRNLVNLVQVVNP